MKFDYYKFDRIVTHGIPTYFNKLPWIDGYIHMGVMINVGSPFDPVGQEGIAHFFEHVPFNGCRQYPSMEMIQSFDRRVLLDTLNANTSFERTLFFVKTSTIRSKQAASFLSDLIFRPCITAESVERERKVITQEFWRKFDTRQHVSLYRSIKEALYGEHVSRVGTPLGWHETIGTISRESLIEFHHRYYHTGNIFLVMVGDTDSDRASEIAEVFSLGAPQGIRAKTQTPPLLSKPKIKKLVLSAEDYFGFTGRSKLQKTKIQVFRVMSIQRNEAVLGIASFFMKQLLYERIRHNLGATYSPNVQWEVYSDHHCMSIFLEVAPHMASRACRIISDLLKEVSDEDPKHSNLFLQIKRAAIERKSSGDCTMGDVIKNAVQDLAVHGGIVPISEELESSRNVSHKDVAHLFQREFSPSQIFWHVLRP